MKDYDSIKQEFNQSNIQLTEVLKRVAPEFSELSLDVQDVAKYSSDPLFLSLLMFRLTKEREQTNQILARIEEKFDQLMFYFKAEKATETGTHVLGTPLGTNEFQLLSEQDEKILEFIDQHSQASADDILKYLKYKKQNAASQRLNNLYRLGHVKKIRQGKKVFFVSSKMVK